MKDPLAEYDDYEPECTTCDGTGWEECEDGYMCREPECDGGCHECPNCGGSGMAKDQTWA